MSTTQDLKEKLLEEFSEKFPETVCVRDNIPPTHIMEDGAILRQWFSSALSQMAEAVIDNLKEYILTHDGGDGFSQADEYIQYLESLKKEGR